MSGETHPVRQGMTLANALTILRLVLIPVFAGLWLHGDDDLALIVFASAAVTDVVDGFVARWLDQRSRLGALLDPVADKILMLVALTVGVFLSAIPVWLAAIVIGRDAVLLFGAIILGPIIKRHRREGWLPTRLGKYAMLLQSTSVAAAIVHDAWAPAWLGPYLRVVMVTCALVTVVAGIESRRFQFQAAAIRKKSLPVIRDAVVPGTVSVTCFVLLQESRQASNNMIGRYLKQVNRSAINIAKISRYPVIQLCGYDGSQ